MLCGVFEQPIIAVFNNSSVNPVFNDLAIIFLRSLSKIDLG